jgi:hypothetical protein
LLEDYSIAERVGQPQLAFALDRERVTHDALTELGRCCRLACRRRT